jgi:hypothetical protein
MGIGDGGHYERLEYASVRNYHWHRQTLLSVYLIYCLGAVRTTSLGSEFLVQTTRDRLDSDSVIDR